MRPPARGSPMRCLLGSVNLFVVFRCQNSIFVIIHADMRLPMVVRILFPQLAGAAVDVMIRQPLPEVNFLLRWPQRRRVDIGCRRIQWS